jgi:hypothetical protein
MAEDYSGRSELRDIATLPLGKEGEYTMREVRNAERKLILKLCDHPLKVSS